MSKPIAVFFSDSHLADRAWAGRDITGDSYFSFKQIIDIAIEKEVETVFGAGDLIDRALNRSGPIAFLHFQLDRLAKAKIKFAYIQGQHEMANPPWLSAHSLPKHISGLSTHVGEFEVFGLDFHPNPLLQTAMATMPDSTDIFLSHQTWSDFMGGDEGPQGGFHDIPIVNTVFTGDYHVHKVTEARGKDGQKLTVISPGSTSMQAIDESPKKYCYTLDGGGTFKKMRLKTRPFIRYDFTHKDDIDMFVTDIVSVLEKKAAELTTEVPATVRTPIIWLVYSHKLTDLRERVMKAVPTGVAHMFWKEIPPEPTQQVVERRRIAKEKGQRRGSTLLSELPAYLDREKLTYIKDDCERLLAADDIEGELQRMRGEVLK